ncbi:MAG: phosphoenolpyruvate--protein phosphotransferase [Lentisphaerae bacterium]|nr:phosphoenolpyruvate--protein phosphotransferase [Lentisphaerota bacterium]
MKIEQENSITEQTAVQETVLKGIAAASGIEIGIALVVGNAPDQPLSFYETSPVSISEQDVPFELARFEAALEATRNEITEICNKVKVSLDENEAGIFEAHLLIVEDKKLKKEVVSGIQDKLLTAESAFSLIMQRYITAISSVADPYLKERAADVVDVAGRILGHLLGWKRSLLDHLPGQRIVVAKELTPSDTVMLDRENVQAFATETGAKTSHSAILARSMRIPAVVGIPGILSKVHNGDVMIIDGYQGVVILNPTPQTLEAYALKEAENAKIYNDLLTESTQRSETLDGYRVALAANLDDPNKADELEKYGAFGVGLFRTEYLFLKDHIPTEEEQYEVYSALASRCGAAPVVIRTLDLGGDKISSLINFVQEPNPFLGLRSVRLCLAYPHLLKPQLRAILRAGVHGNICMMFPMLTCVDELDDLLRILEQIKEDLRREKIRFAEDIKVGVMIETPAAALSADQFAERCDFLSIGTNDLVQYTMAVDRGNERVASLYRPLHPVILRLIRHIVKSAEQAGIWVSICGEMAADPMYIPLLLGLGVRELSMSPVSLAPAKHVVRSMKYIDAEAVAERALLCSSQEEVQELAQVFLRMIAPGVSDLNIT